MNETNNGTRLLQSVQNALRLLDVFSETQTEFTLGELSLRLQLGKSTVHRLLLTLESSGFIARSRANGKYRLGMKLVYLGGLVLKQINLIKVAHPYLEKLAQDVEETVHLVVMDQMEAVFIDKVESLRPMQMGSRIGYRMPAHCAATGKMMLAHLPAQDLEEFLSGEDLRGYTENTITDREGLKKHLQQVKVKGYAVDREESEEGLMCIAAPIRDLRGRVMAAVSISGLAARLSLREGDMAVRVKETAGTISTAMGWHNPS
ncbi:MAG TPA: IclR family transcriptional regulator [Spirochaetia bacterium]|nr:IclR family transcriptional regulator [Spirochaetia bacterium]